MNMIVVHLEVVVVDVGEFFEEELKFNACWEFSVTYQCGTVSKELLTLVILLLVPLKDWVCEFVVFEF